MPLPVTSIYAALLGLLLLVLSQLVVRQRLDREVSLGDGGQEALLLAQRRHGNFVEYVPFCVILLGLNELAGAGALFLHAAGGLLLVSRLLHPFGLATDFGIRPPRFLGTTGTWVVLLVLSVRLLWGAVA